MPHLTEYQQAVEAVILEIINELTDYRARHGLIPAWKKPDGSFVTPADYAVQAYLYRQLTRRFPHIPFIGEETLSSEEDSEKLKAILTIAQRLDARIVVSDLLEALVPPPFPSSLFWLVDPIDGTAGFIKHRFFAVAVSLIATNQPLLSVLACPNSGGTFKIYSALRGHGVSVFSSEKKERYVLKTGLTRAGRFCEASLAARNQQHLATRKLSLQLPWQPQALRADSQYKYALVAESAADFFIRFPFVQSQAHCRDHSPGAFLVEEAGGVVTDGLGSPLHFDHELLLGNHPILVASGDRETHDLLLEIIQKMTPHH